MATVPAGLATVLQDRELLNISATDTLMSVPVPPGPDLRLGRQTALFSTRPFLVGPFHQNFSIAPDDRTFIFMRRATSDETHGVTLTVVLNWLTEVETRMRSTTP
jgi:hypothetical protein